MKNLSELMSERVRGAFARAGYDPEYGKVAVSDRPDLCEFQCSGAFSAAKRYGKAPFLIADEVATLLVGDEMFIRVESVKPGFLNLTLSGEYLTAYLREMSADERFGCARADRQETILIDYGGANVAKPLHVGHLRSAIIGESLKRICRHMGHRVIGDVHLGDWGLQMGLIIAELKERRPNLPYFDPDFEGEYPLEAPFTISQLEKIYPAAAGRAGCDDEYRKAAMEATLELQRGRRGYRALWRHILEVSIEDLRKNYDALSVSFDLWKGESDADPLIDSMVEKMVNEGLAYLSDGALVVDVREDDDKREVPPCMIRKSDGAALYTTTDLATIVWRVRDYNPDRIIYLADKRQEMHFLQVFRCAVRAGLVRENTELKFIGFGTMNGKDGKPFKTREGGVMRLETLIGDIRDKMLDKIRENAELTPAEAEETAGIVALSAVKYADLSNQASKDYIFDTERFISFEGNTGPYVLYTIVRIKSVLRKYYAGKKGGVAAAGAECESAIQPPGSDAEKELMLELAAYSEAVRETAEEMAPHKLCAYVYELSNRLNRFYHGTRILAEADKQRQRGYIALLKLSRGVLESCIDLLGFAAPERM